MTPSNEASDGLVLVQNDQTAGGRYDDWEDVLGERYHFPNQYKNKVKPGTPFVYYRGVRRADGKRGRPEYFGCGRVGDVWRDPRTGDAEPKSHWKWYCTIEEYLPFVSPVAAKANGVATFEAIPENFWGVGVRTISAERLQRILSEARVSEPLLTAGGKLATAPAMPPIDGVTPTIVDHLGAVLAPTPALRGRDPSATARSVQPRRSRFSKLIGDRAEEIIVQMLTRLGVKGLRWLAREGLTPGWDIEYIGEDGAVVAVEVKGTSGDAFVAFDVTASEWEMAREMRSRFRIALVARCLSDSPVVFWLDDPVEQMERNSINADPAVWRITLAASGRPDAAAS